MKNIYSLVIVSLMVSFNVSQAADITWKEDFSGDWFDSLNWEQGTVPVAGDRVIFNDSQVADPANEVNINHAGLGVMLPDDTLMLNDKVIFVDASEISGEPDPVDDVMVFDLIEANGAGGVPVVFNVPLVVNTMTSNRHGAVLNQPFAADSILATSRHQDKWVFNATATAPINYILIDENRGADGDTIDGSFKVNADLTVNQLEFVWGSLQVGADTDVTIGEITYHAFIEQTENNNLSPIIIGENSRIYVEKLTLIDVATGDTFAAENGLYGSEENLEAEVNTPLIEGPGMIVVCQQSVFANDFETNPANCND